MTYRDEFSSLPRRVLMPTETSAHAYRDELSCLSRRALLPTETSAHIYPPVLSQSPILVHISYPFYFLGLDGTSWS